MNNERVIHGRTITPEEVNAVWRLIRDHPDWSRRRLSLEVCASWDWRNAKGELRDMACRTVLLRLHRGGELQLPEPRHKNRCNSHRAAREVAHDTTPVKLPLHEMTPFEVSIPWPREVICSTGLPHYGSRIISHSDILGVGIRASAATANRELLYSCYSPLP